MINMNRLLPLILVSATFLFSSKEVGAQVITLGTTADFVLFSSNGAITNTGASHLTGHVGTNAGSSTGFGNVDGIMHDQDGASALAMADLNVLYGQLDNAIATLFPAPLLGNGLTLAPGVHYISQAASLELELILDGQNLANPKFIIQIDGMLACGPNSKIKLINGAEACNVYWKVEGEVTMAAGTTMRGTVLANQAAITMNAGDTLEGRALSLNGAIYLDGLFAYKPIGCGSIMLTGPMAPTLGSTSCFALFTASGEMLNTGVTTVTGDVGTNVGLTTGFDPLTVTGTVHPIPNTVTDACASDLLVAYTYMNTMSSDIELLYPAQFGNNLVLTPHTYVMNGAVTFTDTLYLNAQDNPDAVFVIKTNAGAMSTSTYSKVILINGAQAKNVYWKIDGALEINDYSIFKGTMIVNGGVVNITSGVNIEGRILATVGDFHTSAITAISDADCGTSGIDMIDGEDAITVYPNPFTNSLTLSMNDDVVVENSAFVLYTVLGEEIMRTEIRVTSTTIETATIPSGVYFYKVIANNQTIQSGKLMAN
jgi:hypothetical protein